MKRIENRDLPDLIFRVTKVNKDGNDDKDEEDETTKTDNEPAGKNGYFKVLRFGNFKRI
jgi:hypothetical protein